MKSIHRIILIVFVAVLLSFSGCADRHVDNPVNPEVIMVAPANLGVSAITETEVTLVWQNANTPATKVIIERSTNATTGFVVVDSVSLPTKTKAVAGLYSADTTYYFRVFNRTGLNKSGYCGPLPVLLLFPPPGPVGIASTTETAVTLQWQNNNIFATRIVIEMSAVDQSNFIPVDSVAAAPVTTHTVSGTFTRGQAYYFRLRAKSNLNTSLPEWNANLVSYAKIHELPEKVQKEIADKTRQKIRDLKAYYPDETPSRSPATGIYSERGRETAALPCHCSHEKPELPDP